MSSTKVAVVTGANKGIGYAIVKRLCKQFPGTVILTARDEQRGLDAVNSLSKEGCSAKFHQLDILCRESIQKLKKFLEEQYGGLDILVNNAGIAYKMSSTAPFTEQAEVTLRTNFQGTLDVCHALFPLLKPHARVVNVSSMLSRLSQVSEEWQKKFRSTTLTEEELISLMDQFIRDVKDGVHKEKGWSNSAYGTSKIGVTALSKIQARAFSQDSREDILINACCPGWVRTDMAGPKAPKSPDEGLVLAHRVAMEPHYYAWYMRGTPTNLGWHQFPSSSIIGNEFKEKFVGLNRFVTHSKPTMKGAETPVYLALLPPNAGAPHGEFVSDKKVQQW